MATTVYTKPNCPQCFATKRALTKAGIAFAEVDLTQDEDALREVKDRGFQQAPVVVAGKQAWAGFQLDRIKALSA